MLNRRKNKTYKTLKLAGGVLNAKLYDVELEETTVSNESCIFSRI